MSRPKDQYNIAFTKIMLDRINEENSDVDSAMPSEALKQRIDNLINNKMKYKSSLRFRPAYLLAAVISIASVLIIFVIHMNNNKEAEFPVLQVNCDCLQSQSIKERLLSDEYAISEVPDGFIFKDTACSDDMLQHTYTSKSGAAIILTQLASAYFKLDRQYAMETITNAQGNSFDVYLLNEKSSSDAYWINNGYLFNLRTVDCSLSKDSIYEIIKSIIKVS